MYNSAEASFVFQLLEMIAEGSKEVDEMIF